MNQSTKAFQHHSHVGVSIFHYHYSSFLIFLFSSLILCFLCFLLFSMLLHPNIPFFFFFFFFSGVLVWMCACMINHILSLVIKLIYWFAIQKAGCQVNLERKKILFDFGYHFFFLFSFFFFFFFFFFFVAASAAFVFHPHLSFLLFLPLLSLHLKTTKKKPFSLFASDYIGVISANHVILSCSFGEVYLFFIFIFIFFYSTFISLSSHFLGRILANPIAFIFFLTLLLLLLLIFICSNFELIHRTLTKWGDWTIFLVSIPTHLTNRNHWIFQIGIGDRNCARWCLRWLFWGIKPRLEWWKKGQPTATETTTFSLLSFSSLLFPFLFFFDSPRLLQCKQRWQKWTKGRKESILQGAITNIWWKFFSFWANFATLLILHLSSWFLQSRTFYCGERFLFFSFPFFLFLLFLFPFPFPFPFHSFSFSFSFPFLFL